MDDTDAEKLGKVDGTEDKGKISITMSVVNGAPNIEVKLKGNAKLTVIEESSTPSKATYYRAKKRETDRVEARLREIGVTPNKK